MADPRVALAIGLQDIISNGLGRIEGKLQELEGQAKELDTTLKTLKGFKELSQKIEELEKKELDLENQTQRLRESKEKLQAQLKKLKKEFKKGKISEEEYRQKSQELQKEILQIENKLQSLETELKQVRSEKNKLINESIRLKQELQKLGIEVSQVDKKIEEYEKELSKLSKTTERASRFTETLKAGLSALPGAGIIAGITHEVFGLEGAVRSVIAQTAVFDTTTREKFENIKKKLKKDILEIKKATGAGFAEIEDRLVQLIQYTGKYDESVKKAVISALQIERITRGKLEGQELIRAMTQLSKNLKVPIEEAGNYILAVYQKVGDKGGDLLDTFWEYSDALRDAGITAKEFSAVLIAGAQAGAFNFDKLGDLLKQGLKASLPEASTLQELLGNIEQNQAGLIDQLWGKGSKEWAKLKSALIDYISAIKKGDKELAKSAFANLAGTLAIAYKKDATKTKEIIQKIFGAIGSEDLGIKVLEAVSSALANPEKYLKGAKDVKKSFEEALSPVERFQMQLSAVFTQLVQVSEPYFSLLADGFEKISRFIEEHRTLATVLLGGIGAFTTAGIAIKGLGMAYSFVKGTILGLLSPLRLFRRETQETCKTGICVSKLGKGFSLLGENVKKLKGIKGIFENLIPANFRKIITGRPTKGILSKVFRLGLKGLRFGRFLLGLSSPVGLALTALSFAPDIFSFLKNFGLGKRLLTGLKDIGGKVWEGVKGFWGIGEEEKTREVVKEVTREATLSTAVEKTTEKIFERNEGQKVINVTYGL